MTIKDENKEGYRVLKSNISFNIKKYRKEKHFTQEELAEYANISYDFMRRIESKSNGCGFSVYTLYKLAQALDVKMDDLAETHQEELVKTN